jgi:hypothetical protein
VTDIATILSQSSMSSAQEAARALRAGGNISIPRSERDVSGLALTYRMRLGHLKSLPGPYAAATAASVSELLQNLQAVSSVQTAVVEGPDEHIFFVFLSETGSTVLGCISGVDSRKVSEERWRQLWQGAV